MRAVCHSPQPTTRDPCTRDKLGGMDAFESFEFEGNAGWLRHLATVEVPGEREGAGCAADSRAIRLVKAKWYKREIDPNFDLSLVRNSKPRQKAGPSGASDATPSSSYEHRGRERPPPPPRQRTTPTSTSWTDTALFFMRVVLVLLSAASFFPFVPATRKCFTWALQMAVGVHGQKLYSTYRLPPLRPFPGGLTSWFQPIRGNTDFHYLCYALLFTTGR